MDYHIYYEMKLNDVITKCPIEAGVEILVYQLLDRNISLDKYSIVDINRVWKKCDPRLVTDGGVPDIAVMSRDFVYQGDKGSVFGFVEVKSAGYKLTDTEQILGHIKGVRHFLYTNGIFWKYYTGQEKKWEISIAKEELVSSTTAIMVEPTKLEKLQEYIKQIAWND